jgi:hypothetical protein
MIQVCEEENQILRNVVVKLTTANNSGIGNKYFRLHIKRLQLQNLNGGAF